MELRARRRQWQLTLLLLSLLLFATVIFSSTVGPADLRPLQVGRALLSRVPGLRDLLGDSTLPQRYQIILFQIRLPRILMGAMIGAALAGAGVVFQGVFKNPMAEPYIIGVSSGASLGAAVAIVLASSVTFMGLGAVPIFAFLGGVGTLLVVYNLARHGNRVPVGTLLLAGIAISSFISAIVSLVMVLSREELQQIVFWIMGGLSASSWTEVRMITPYTLLGLFILIFYTRELNILLLGEESAQHLGVDVERVKKILLVVASLVTSAAVAGGGVIGFVGLIVPHTMRLLVGPDHRILLPSSILTGAIFLVLADVLARSLISPMEIPLGIITSLCGAPFFIYLLRRRKQNVTL